MCLTAIGLALGAAHLANAMDQQRRARHAIDDQRNAVAAVETKAAQDANAKVAARRRALRDNSLMVADSAGVSTGGRATLGGQ